MIEAQKAAYTIKRMCELLGQLYHCLQHRRVFTGQGIPGAAQRRGIADNPLGGQPRRVGRKAVLIAGK